MPSTITLHCSNWRNIVACTEGKWSFPTAVLAPIQPLPSDFCCLNYWRRTLKANTTAVMTGCQLKCVFISVGVEQVVCLCDMQWLWWTWSNTGISWTFEYLSSEILYQGANFVGYADTQWEGIRDILLPVLCLCLWLSELSHVERW
jgi:hypothetical protein